MPVFFLSTPVDAEGRFQLSAGDWRHLQKVLRLRTGDLFQVYLPDGSRAEAELASQAGLHYGIVKRRFNLPAPRPLPLWLGMGFLRASRLEWAVEKLTELGLARLSLLRFQQGRQGKSQDISSNKINRLIKISKETLKQCERTTSTQIESPLSFEAFLNQVETEATQAQKIILLERAEAPFLAERIISKKKSWVILVGPEGGFSRTESETAQAQGFEAASLGTAILRSETAALYASCVLDSLLKGKG
ncbi:MAG TPA: hypothetical protein DF383_01960 [Deltaproteobacteria bacterium]|nr:hypothetical protein [Deltaproteobacteria bacterium]